METSKARTFQITQILRSRISKNNKMSTGNIKKPNSKFQFPVNSVTNKFLVMTTKPISIKCTRNLKTIVRASPMVQVTQATTNIMVTNNRKLQIIINPSLLT